MKLNYLALLYITLHLIILSACSTSDRDSTRNATLISENIPKTFNFESEDSLDLWRATGTNSISLDNSISYNGNSSLHIENNSVGNTSIELLDNIVIKKNRVLAISVKTRGIGSVSKPEFTVRLIGKEKEYSKNSYGYNDPVNNVWIDQNFYFHIDDPVATLKLQIDAAWSEVWIDEVELKILVADTTKPNFDDFQGQWKTDCTMTSIGTSLNFIITNTAITHSRQQYNYNDSVCTDFSYAEPVDTWEYSSIGEIVTENGLSLRQIKFTGKNIITPYVFVYGDVYFFYDFTANLSTVIGVQAVYRRLSE